MYTIQAKFAVYTYTNNMVHIHRNTILVLNLVIPLPLTSPGRGFRVVSAVNRFNLQGMTKSIIIVNNNIFRV